MSGSQTTSDAPAATDTRVRLGVHLTEENHRRLRAAAERDERSLDAQIRHYVGRCLDADEAAVAAA